MVEAKIDSSHLNLVVGNSYEVKVIKMLDFGAVVEYLDAPGNEVLLHVSELAWERTENVTDVVNMGDVFEVKYFGLDARTRKEKVSRKALLEKPKAMLLVHQETTTAVVISVETIENQETEINSDPYLV